MKARILEPLHKKWQIHTIYLKLKLNARIPMKQSFYTASDHFYRGNQRGG